MTDFKQPSIEGLEVIQPNIFDDTRGYFCETFNQSLFNALIGDDQYRFVQDNQSFSHKGVLRGLHYQVNQVQGKLVRAISGEIFDVAVDLRKSSKTFGQWFGITLSHLNLLQLWIPPGFAHGFVVISNQAEVLYKATNFWSPEDERSIRWNDADLSIEWPINHSEVIISSKDNDAATFQDSEYFL